MSKNSENKLNLFARRPRMRKVLIAIAGLSFFTLAIGGTAYANASSGWILGNHDGSHYYCNEATISTGAYFAGYIESNDADSCGTGLTSPDGYLGVLVNGYFNGSLCGQLGYEVNDTPESSFGIGGYFCPGEGTGTFNTSVNNEYFNYGADEYYAAGSATSPGQTYSNVVGAGGSSSNQTEGPVPASDFNGGPLSITSMPSYISVYSGGEIVGYVSSSYIVTPPGDPVANPTNAPVPVYNASLQEVVGHMVSGDGFVPLAGSGLPSTYAPGTSASWTILP